MRISLCALIWMGLVLAALADPASVRIAVISDPSDQDLAALVTIELSNRPDITLVERDDLAKAGDELKLQQLAGSDAAALGKLVGADGLLFLNKAADGIQIRFTAVGLGYALFDDEIASEIGLPQLAKSITHRLAGYALKLKLDPAKAIPISVLNLRADTASKNSDKIERSLTLLLESRLASLPEYVVLERRHAWSLSFERSLSTTPKPLLQGAYVVDGTLSFLLQNQGAGDILVHLRVRSPHNQQTPLEIHGPGNDLPGLVEQMTGEIQKSTGSTSHAPPWQPQKEAREYLLEGIWGYEHNANEAALEALDSAELLGETAPDLIAVRITMLRKRASQGMELYGGREPFPDGSPSPDQRTDDILEAIKETARYDAGQMESRLELLSANRNLDVRAWEMKSELAELGSRFLINLDDAGSPRADELRQSLRSITDYDPLHGKLGAGYSAHPYLLHDVYADEWAASLKEELAYYHLLYTAPNQFLPPWLVTGHGEGFCHRFLKNPEVEKKTFDQFVQALQNDPAGKLSYLLIMSSSPDDATANGAYKGYLEELWNRRDSLVQEKELRSEWYNTQYLPDNLRQRHATDAIPLLRYYLTHVNTFRYWEHSIDTMWQPEGWSKAEAAAIWTEYLGYKQRIEVDWKAHDRNWDALVAGLAKFEEPFLQKFPQLAATKAGPTTRLTLTHFWYPGLAGDQPQGRLTIPDCQVTDDGLCVLGRYYASPPNTGLYQVSFPSLKTERLDLPGAANARSLRATPDAFYVEYFKRDDNRQYICRIDRKSGAREERVTPMPFLDTAFFPVDGFFYLSFGEGGLARYAWNQDKITLLASSRRKPAQNQFDDRPRYVITGVFAGPGHRACAAVDGSAYYIQDTPGPWPQVYDSDLFNASKTIWDKTFVWSQYGEVVLLDPAKSQPEYLMTPAQPHYRHMGALNHKSQREMAPWAARTYWDAPEEQALKSNGNSSSSIGMHDDEFFVLVSPMIPTESYELLVYSKATGRAPRHIPLDFHLDDATHAALAPIYSDHSQPAPEWTLDKIEHPGSPFFSLNLLTTKEGLCLVSYVGGFWFIPYTDIDAYLQAHPAPQPGPAKVTSISN